MYFYCVKITFLITGLCIITVAPTVQAQKSDSLHTTKAYKLPQKKHIKKAASQNSFDVYGENVKFVVYHTDSIITDSGGPYITNTTEYVWDTINAGYIFVIKEQRLFCNGVKSASLEGDIKNILSVIPKNGFRLLDKVGGEFYVNVQEALYDGSADSIFIAVDIDGFIGGDAQFEEHGVVGMKYKELQQYNDSLYKRPDQYPMNRFGRHFQLR